MQYVSENQVRSNWDSALSRVEPGNRLTITRNGVPVAVLSPACVPAVNAHALIEAWRNVPVIDAQRLRDDVETIMGFDAVLP